MALIKKHIILGNFIITNYPEKSRKTAKTSGIKARLSILRLGVI